MKCLTSIKMLMILLAFLLHGFASGKTNQTISGTVVDKFGNPAANVQLDLFESDFLALQSDKRKKTTVTTQNNGSYQFRSIQNRLYTLIGKRDKLSFFRGNINPESNYSSPFTDTLREPGSLYFNVRQEKLDDQRNLSAYLYGTPYTIKAAKDGALEFLDIPQGAFAAVIASKLPGYHSIQCSLHINSGIADTFPETLDILFTGKKKITTISASVDSSRNAVQLSWNYDDPVFYKFKIFRSTDPHQFSAKPIASTSDRTFTDHITDNTNPYFYFIGSNHFLNSDTIKIQIVATKKALPEIKKTPPEAPKKATEEKRKPKTAPVSSLPLQVFAKVDKNIAKPRETVRLLGSVSPQNTAVKKWEWSIRGADFTEAVSDEFTIIAPLIPAVVSCILKVTSNDGRTAYDTVTFTVRSTTPVIIARGDTISGIFEKVNLSITIPDMPKTLSTSWDIGNTGSFINSPNGNIKIGPFKKPTDSFICIAQAIDENGERGFDTLKLKSQLLWKVLQPLHKMPLRKSHSLITFDKSLWCIGGNQSDVWRSNDGVTWESKNLTAPFGKRFGHATVIFKEKMLLIGGKIGKDSLPGDIWSSQDGVNWNKIAESPLLQRYYHSAILFKDQIILIGGLNDSASNACLNDICSSNDGIHWKTLRESAEFNPRYGQASIVFNNSLYVIGGSFDGIYGSETFQDTWKSSDGIKWSQIATNTGFPQNQFLTCVEYDNQIWAIGGFCKNAQDGNVFSNVWCSSDGINWKKISNGKCASESYFVAGTVFNDKIITSPSGTEKLWLLR